MSVQIRQEEINSMASELVQEAAVILQSVTEVISVSGSAEEFLAMSENCSRAASMLKIAAVLDSLVSIGEVKCPECGTRFAACSHRVSPDSRRY